MPSCEYLIGDRCSQDLFGGFPKPIYCESCNRYKGPDRGLGDKVHRVLLTIGGKRLERRTGCRCGYRRAALNRLLPNKD